MESLPTNTTNDSTHKNYTLSNDDHEYTTAKQRWAYRVRRRHSLLRRANKSFDENFALIIRNARLKGTEEQQSNQQRHSSSGSSKTVHKAWSFHVSSQRHDEGCKSIQWSVPYHRIPPLRDIGRAQALDINSQETSSISSILPQETCNIGKTIDSANSGDELKADFPFNWNSSNMVLNSPAPNNVNYEIVNTENKECDGNVNRDDNDNWAVHDNLDDDNEREGDYEYDAMYNKLTEKLGQNERQDNSRQLLSNNGSESAVKSQNANLAYLQNQEDFDNQLQMPHRNVRALESSVMASGSLQKNNSMTVHGKLTHKHMSWHGVLAKNDSMSSMPCPDSTRKSVSFEKRLPLAKFSTESDEKICRICFEDDTVEKLICPCYCSGTGAWIHRRCLEEWLTISQSFQCEVCEYCFNIKLVLKPIKKWRKPLTTREHFYWIYYQLFITVCCVFTPVVCYLLVISLTNLKSFLGKDFEVWKVLAIMLGGTVTLSLYLVSIAYCVYRFIELARLFMETNRMIVLDMPEDDSIRKSMASLRASLVSLTASIRSGGRIYPAAQPQPDHENVVAVAHQNEASRHLANQDLATAHSVNEETASVSSTNPETLTTSFHSVIQETGSSLLSEIQSTSSKPLPSLVEIHT